MAGRGRGEDGSSGLEHPQRTPGWRSCAADCRMSAAAARCPCRCHNGQCPGRHCLLCPTGSETCLGGCSLCWSFYGYAELHLISEGFGGLWRLLTASSLLRNIWLGHFQVPQTWLDVSQGKLSWLTSQRAAIQLCDVTVPKTAGRGHVSTIASQHQPDNAP